VILRELLFQIFQATVTSTDVATRVHDALPPRPPRALSASIIAMGKAAPAMVAGALERWGPFVEKVLIVTADGVPCGLTDPRIELLRAPHPLPDKRSIAAAVRAIDVAREAQGLVLALVSGGASSLVAAPIDGISLEEKREIITGMMGSAATIQELNTVRRHISKVKGGGLTRAAAPTHTLAYIVSDVIGGAPEDVGSGPTVPDPTTAAQARAILLHHARRFRRVPMKETLKPGDPEASLQKVRTILAPDDLARIAAELLMKHGYGVRVLPPVSAEVQRMASEYRELAHGLTPGAAVVRAAEPLVAMGGVKPGRGGRAGHLAAVLAHTLPADVAFLCGASDGVDGASGTAGAIVDADFCAMIDEARCDEAIRRFDTAALHEEAGTALPGGPTGLNLADLHVLARAR
jgi:glycerate 2-kinase